MVEPGRRSRLRARIALCLAACVLSLIVAEVTLRLFFPVGRTFVEQDPELLYRLIPDQRTVHISTSAAGDRWIRMDVNPDGFRGPALDASHTSPRLVVYGDSLVMGDNVQQDETFVARLGAQIETLIGVSWEVVNAGVTGYGPDQSCLRLTREIKALDPDVVVLVLCANNDFGDLLRNKLFRLDDQDRLQRHAWVAAPETLELFDVLKSESERFALPRLVSRMLQSRETRSEREKAAGADRPPYIQWYMEAAAAEYAAFVENEDSRVGSLFSDYYDADVAVSPALPSARYKRRFMRAVLDRIRQVCAEATVPFFVLVVPSAVDLDPEFDIRVDPLMWPGYSPSQLTDVLAALLTELRIPFLDLYARFGSLPPRDVFVGGDDIHWTVKGQDLAAEWTAAALRDLGFLTLDR